MSKDRINVVASGRGAIAAGGSIGFVSTGDNVTVTDDARTRKVRDDRPRVGVSLLVVKGDKFLAGLRLGSHGTGEWGTPGGHQELGESYEETAIRELAEECGNDVLIARPRFLCVTNLTQYIEDSGRHYTDVALTANWLAGEPKLMEPKKCGGWEWLNLETIYVNAFGAVPNMQEAYRSGRAYFG